MSKNASTSSSKDDKKKKNYEHLDYKTFFKRHFSLNHEDPSVNKSDRRGNSDNIDENLANLSLKSTDELANSGVLMSNPGPSVATVQHTEHILAPINETANIVVNDKTYDGPTVHSLKQNLLNANESSQTPTMSSASVSTLNDNSSMGTPTTATTQSEFSTSNHNNSNSSISKKQSHPYQYEYFPLTEDKNSNSIDADAGVLQNEDKVINQAILQHVVKRDMKRKRNDSLSNKQNEVKITPTKEKSNVMSPTAAIMMKLYKDNSQHKRDQANEVYKRNINSANNNNSFIDVRLKATEENPPTAESPENKKLKKKESTASESSYSTDSDIEMDSENNVEVILKWRDNIPNIADAKFSIVSKEIVSTLLAIHAHYDISDIDREESRLGMLFDRTTKEWFLPGLYLPPGVYRFQFSTHGELTHSNYLPTATNTLGSIVNWFEVLPGYETIEPYRDSEKINASSVKLDSVGTNTRTYSTTSLTDFAGISRTSSMINKSSMSTLKLSNFFTQLQPLTTNEIKYSNEIPEIFKFDSDDANNTNGSNPTNAPFDMTLSNVVDSNQDKLFANMQKVARMSAEEAEAFFLAKFKVAELPVYLNSTYLNKNFNNEANNIIPHVNLNHLLTSSIKDEIICVGCTTRYAGKFITQAMYAPCISETEGE